MITFIKMIKNTFAMKLTIHKKVQISNNKKYIKKKVKKDQMKK